VKDKLKKRGIKERNKILTVQSRLDFLKKEVNRKEFSKYSRNKGSKKEYGSVKFRGGKKRDRERRKQKGEKSEGHSIRLQWSVESCHKEGEKVKIARKWQKGTHSQKKKGWVASKQEVPKGLKWKETTNNWCNCTANMAGKTSSGGNRKAEEDVATEEGYGSVPYRGRGKWPK